MNPFGSTRQSVGGENQYEPPRRRKWWDTVPFRPCRPPTPPWIIDWPLEVLSRTRGYMGQYSACLDVAEDPNAVLHQDPRVGMVPGLVTPSIPVIDSGPAANVLPFTSVINPGGNRVWFAHLRSFTNARTIAVSPIYNGPARITSVAFQYSLGPGGGATPHDSFGIGVGGGENVDTGSPVTSAPSGFSIFDSTSVGDSLYTNATEPYAQLFPEQSNLVPWNRIQMNVHVPMDQFKVWAVLRTNSPTASILTLIVTLETAGGEDVAQGKATSFYGLPPTWQPGYIG